MSKAYAPVPCPRNSPWGHIDNRECMAPGLWSVQTPRHGGLFMSPERLADFRKAFPTFEGYAGLPWLEEDYDWALAGLLFANELPPKWVYYAVRTVEAQPAYFIAGFKWLNSPDGEAARNIAAAYNWELVEV